MKLEELLQEAYGNGWNSCANQDYVGYIKFSRDYKEEIDQAKREVIEEFIRWSNEYYKVYSVPIMIMYDEFLKFTLKPQNNDK